MSAAKRLVVFLCAVPALSAVSALADPLPETLPDTLPAQDADTGAPVEAGDDAASLANRSVATPSPLADAPLVIVGNVSEVGAVADGQAQSPMLADPSWARTPVSAKKSRRSGPSFGVSVGNGGTETPDRRRELRDGDW